MKFGKYGSVKVMAFLQSSKVHDIMLYAIDVGTFLVGNCTFQVTITHIMSLCFTKSYTSCNEPPLFIKSDCGAVVANYNHGRVDPDFRGKTETRARNIRMNEFIA